MNYGKDARTLAHINMYAMLSCMSELCAISPAASVLASPDKPVVLCLKIRRGPALTMTFERGICKTYEGSYTHDILLRFPSYEKFNGMLDKSRIPIPIKGFGKQAFLRRNFSLLSDILGKYLGTVETGQFNEAFFQDSTSLLFSVYADAIAQVANQDSIGRFTASGMVDGTLVMSIQNGPKAALQVAGHTIKRLSDIPDSPTAIVEFKSARVARDVFDGRQGIPVCLGTGLMEPGGHMGLLLPFYRLLERVAVYLR